VALHEACYAGDLAAVRALLDRGEEPNAEATSGRWVSCRERPRPLNCVAIAWAMTEDHVRIARLLIERGAVVDETVRRDHGIESAGREADAAFAALIAE